MPNIPIGADLSISTLSRNYGTGAWTPTDVVNHVYQQIEAAPLHPVWIHLVPRSEALARATDLQTKHPGPLYGIPFAVKDNIDVAGLPTTAGCPDFAYTPQQSATVVQKLQDAGAILIGKTNMDQFATGLVGTRSPYGACSSVFNKEYVSGGSSSGSAVAVASGLVTFALGTDTAGSGRVPAAFNNLIGLKPTRGILSAAGVVPACRSLDCVSIFAPDASSAAAVFHIAKGFDAADPYSRNWPATSSPIPARFRCGIPKKEQLEFFGNAEGERIYTATVADLQASGAQIVEFDLQPFRAAAELLYAGPYVAERYAAVGAFVSAHPDAVDPVVGSIIRNSARYTAAEAYAAEYQLEALRKQVAPQWQNMDLMLLPTAPTTYKIAAVQQDPIKLNSNLGYYTNFVNLMDLSAVAVPAGFGSDGLPFGVTLVAPAFSDYTLLQLASQLQHRLVPFAGNHLAPLKDLPAFEATAPASGWVKLAVVGAHLSGQPLNSQLVERGSRLLKTTRTAPDYKLFALTGTLPPKPGLLRTPGFQGQGIEVEVWLMPEREFGSFVALVPAPLGIGTCELIDGERVKGFVCEEYGTLNMPDITSFGSWRRYLAR